MPESLNGAGCAEEAPGAWYAVQLKPNREDPVHRRFRTEAIPAFLPLIETIRSRRGRRIAVLEPLFPGYLFVKMGPPDSTPSTWRRVRWTPGVIRILGADTGPLPVPDGAIEAIQARVSKLGFVRRDIRFGRSSKVIIRRGPFAGLEALFERPLGRAGRVRVLMALLGGECFVDVDAVDIESA